MAFSKSEIFPRQRESKEVEAVYDFACSYPGDVVVSAGTCILNCGREDVEGECEIKINMSHLRIYFEVSLKITNQLQDIDLDFGGANFRRDDKELHVVQYNSSQGKMEHIKCVPIPIDFSADFDPSKGTDMRLSFFPKSHDSLIMTRARKNGEGEKLSHLVFHLFNLAEPSFAESRFFEMEHDGWKVEISNLKYEESETSENESRRYFITHQGKLSRIGGGAFAGQESRKFLEKLGYFLSFCRGGNTFPMFLVGFESAGKVPVWEDWRPLNRCDFEMGRANWFYPHLLNSELLSPLFNCFMKSLDSPEWRDIIIEGINGYVHAVSASFFRNRSILTQVAFETMFRKCWIRKKQHDIERGINGKDQYTTNARTKMVWALAFIFGFDCKTVENSPLFRKIFLTFPEGTGDLEKLTLTRSERNFYKERSGTSAEQKREKKWRDPIDALIRIRNRYVHGEMTAEEEQNNMKAYFQVTQLGFWYIEMAILKICGYEGTCINRLLIGGVRKDGKMVRYVPWREG